jgi:hypothetical protein
MKDRACAILLFGLALMAAAPALAATDDGRCANGGFPRENADFGLATINGLGRARLLVDITGCPKSATWCEHYVLPGNRVVTGRTMDDYVCVYFPNRVGGSAGWVNKSRLRLSATVSSPPASSWLGRWSDEGNPSVRVTLAGAILHVDGEAFWPGPNPEKGWPIGWPHTGEIEGELTVEGNRGVYDNGECKIDFSLVGDTLIARDNSQCGGANVRFDGVYRRKNG